MVEEDCSWIDMDMDLVAGDMRRRRRKKRFSEEQVRSLESMFESQAKLDPSKKLQLAGELGLQPRQVAIWFQNKRARWKSKQLEREYGALKASYDDLRSRFESLKKEKLVLTKQLQMLRERLDERPDKRIGGEVDHRVAIQQPMMNTNDLIDKEAAAAEQQLGFLHTWPSDHQLFSGMQWWDFWPVNE